MPPPILMPRAELCKHTRWGNNLKVQFNSEYASSEDARGRWVVIVRLNPFAIHRVGNEGKLTL
jgi:hypothetical protein